MKINGSHEPKLMVFGKGNKIDITFNGKLLDWVDNYKYLGNIINTTKLATGDIFKDNSVYLCDKARKAIFSFLKKVKPYGTLPPKLMIKAYKVLIEPILLYGSDVWASSKHMLDSIDKVCLFFIRYILRVKPTTSNLMCFGEVGIIPPSVIAKTNFLNFYIRVKQAHPNSLENIALKELYEFNDVGFTNIISTVNKIAKSHNINLDLCSFTKESTNSLKLLIKSDYIQSWHDSVVSNNSTLRWYKHFKKSFGADQYLSSIKNDKHRHALTKFRCSSHFLEIERARHQNNIPPIWKRTCPYCPNAVDDELHLLLFCSKNRGIRQAFLDFVFDINPDIANMHHNDKFITIMSSDDNNIIKSLGKFIYESLESRKVLDS